MVLLIGIKRRKSGYSAYQSAFPLFQFRIVPTFGFFDILCLTFKQNSFAFWAQATEHR